jgi:uncharacterized membrane protein
VAGEIDNWAERPMAFLLASIPLILIGLALVIPKMDPQRKNYKLHEPAFFKTIFAVGIFLIALHWFSISYMLGLIRDMPMVVLISVGVLFVIIGNFLPQAKHNYTYGIRLPWTLASENVWKKTHRLAGFCFVAAGLILIGAAFFPLILRTVMAIFAISSAVIIPGVYSYVTFQREKTAID